jgi:3-oxoacyl-[acyl-carrier-protein] synthase-3
MSRAASLIATGRYLPERLVTNDELRHRFAALGKEDLIDRFEAGSGIRQRWYAPDHWCTSDLALPAARQALERAERVPRDVDLILLGTDTPDRLTPATSTRLQALLGADRAGTFDIGCACASFPTAVATATGLIAANPGIRTVLVVSAYLMQRFADPDDPMVFFYGDGAGAAVIEASDEPGVLASAFRADGRYADYWSIDAGGTAEPASVAAVEAGRTRVRLHQRYPPEVNENGWPDLVRDVLERCERPLQAVDEFVFTQVNRSTIENVCDRLGVDRSRAITIMQDCGYIGSACVPVALDRSLADGRSDRDSLVVLTGSGVGYNMAAVALQLNARLAWPRLR